MCVVETKCVGAATRKEREQESVCVSVLKVHAQTMKSRHAAEFNFDLKRKKLFYFALLPLLLLSPGVCMCA